MNKIKIQCNECDSFLTIYADYSRVNGRGDHIVVVDPCQGCIDEAVAERDGDQVEAAVRRMVP